MRVISKLKISDLFSIKFVPLLTAIVIAAGTQPANAAPRLKVSDNKRFLVKEDGSPFFYLGDTAWELFHRLNREEADKYLRDFPPPGHIQ